MINIFSTGEVARMLQIPSYKIGYAHSTGLLAEPGFRFLGKRCYDEEDIRRAAAHFRVTIANGDILATGQEVKCNS